MAAFERLGLDAEALCAHAKVPTETWEMKLEVWDPEWRSRLEGLAAELERRLDAPGFVSSTSQAIRNLLPQKGCDLREL